MAEKSSCRRSKRIDERLKNVSTIVALSPGSLNELMGSCGFYSSRDELPCQEEDGVMRYQHGSMLRTMYLDTVSFKNGSVSYSVCPHCNLIKDLRALFKKDDLLGYNLSAMLDHLKKVHGLN